MNSGKKPDMDRMTSAVSPAFQLGRRAGATSGHFSVGRDNSSCRPAGDVISQSAFARNNTPMNGVGKFSSSKKRPYFLVFGPTTDVEYSAVICFLG